MQFKVAKEESKFGIDPDNLNAFMRELENENLSNVRVDGIMGMASFTDNEDQVRAEFTFLKSIFDQLKLQYFDNSTSFREISMGMSSDYKMALEEGSTMVRLGSVLFE